MQPADPHLRAGRLGRLACGRPACGRSAGLGLGIHLGARLLLGCGLLRCLGLRRDRAKAGHRIGCTRDFDSPGRLHRLDLRHQEAGARNGRGVTS
ncbi:hypothetical protein AKJ08_2558 [Vulgatibacter incomptus]|uniref:Uncharacterized protein n=1 Tax=Vulgatibacter incomptus TaxID=1391653 RepID=A0A0K1PFG1_9BACT|nr:hypothetical protein AKJ08_2558 [Vulgatibacter incomptus]